MWRKNYRLLHISCFADRFVGVGNFLEFLFGKLDECVGKSGTLHLVGVKFSGFFAVGFFDFRIAGIGSYSEEFITFIQR